MARGEEWRGRGRSGEGESEQGEEWRGRERSGEGGGVERERKEWRGGE